MEQIDIRNAFPGAAVFRIGTTGSTMDDARRLAKMGFYPGTTVTAEAQTAGRGRLPERRWESAPGDNLLATVILERTSAELPGFTLRIGLALCRAVSIFAIRQGMRLDCAPRLKWPNDVLIGDRKLAGILCEAAEDAAYVGFGINVNQRSFPPALGNTATSLVLAAGRAAPLPRLELLEIALEQIYFVLVDEDWRAEATERLWRHGERVAFLTGLAADQGLVEGILEGIAPSGALLIRTEGDEAARSFVSGELRIPTGFS